MDLEDFYIIQDEFSNTTFNEGKIIVLGYCGRHKNRAKMYAVQCLQCCQDPELFGDGIFRTVKRSLELNIFPCACNARYTYTEKERVVQLTRIANSRNISFIGFAENYIGSKTRLKLSCNLHGAWDTTNISNFQLGNGCPECRKISIGESNRKNDSFMIASFMASGSYVEHTKFWRSDKKDSSSGGKVYWNVYCPVCLETNTSHCGSLQQGKLPCGCVSHTRATFSYIMNIVDGENLIALKFGISSNPIRRLSTVNLKSSFDIELPLVWKFETENMCRAAEKQCKLSLVCGIIDKNLMVDGWSETTHIENLLQIQDIFKSYGGVEVEKDMLMAEKALNKIQKKIKQVKGNVK